MLNRKSGIAIFLTSSVMAICLAGCGEMGGGNTAESKDATKNSSVDVDAAIPTVSQPPSLPVVALPPCEAQTPNVCIGPLVAGLEDVTLQWAGKATNDGRRQVQGSATLTLSGRVGESVRIALLNGEIALKYSNGTVLTFNHVNQENVSGLKFCGYSGEECVNTALQNFTPINPGDSPINVTFQFRGYVDGSQIGSLANANTADLSMSVWMIHQDPAGEQRTISIRKAPVANSTIE